MKDSTLKLNSYSSTILSGTDRHIPNGDNVQENAKGGGERG